MADEGLTNVEPVDTASPYAEVLKRCALAGGSWSACGMSVLPPLRVDHPNPTTDDIMSRALVSHPWMGERLREALDAMPEDVRYLFGAISAVVVDDDIRPSYYNSQTGAIYLDPGYFWLDEEEYAVIDKAPDYRSAFADPMSFRSYWRYVSSAEVETSASGRTLEEILPNLAALLFHELAHANDFVPDETTLDLDQTFSQAWAAKFPQSPSSQLTESHGLESDLWKRMAGILYLGARPSGEDVLFTAEAVGAEFALDGANDDYNYSSQYEDLAMLFEESMMRLHFEIVRDVAFVNPAPPDSTECDDTTIGWGMRGRIGDPVVKERAEVAVALLLPERDYSEFFANLPEPIDLPVGEGWCASLDFEPDEAVGDALLFKKATAVTARKALPLDNTRRRAPVVW